MKAFDASFGIEFELVLFLFGFLGGKSCGILSGLPGWGEKGFSRGYMRGNGKMGGKWMGGQWMNELRRLLRYGFANADAEAVFPVSGLKGIGIGSGRHTFFFISAR
jgi:hypothetical protein